MYEVEARYQRLEDEGSSLSLDHKKLRSAFIPYLEGDPAKGIEELQKIGLEKIEKSLRTNFELGIKDDLHISERVKLFGSNKPQKNALCSYFSGFPKSKQAVALSLIFILTVCYIVLINLENDSSDLHYEAYGLLVIVIASLLICFFQLIQNRVSNNLNQVQIFKVKRNCTILEISSENLLAGDLMLLEIGNIVPCYGLVVDSSNLSCKESSKTVSKAPLTFFFSTKYSAAPSDSTQPSPFLLMNTIVSEGFGEIIVTGFEDFLPKSKKSEKNPSSSKPINKLSKIINKIRIYSIFFIFAALLTRFLIRLSTYEELRIEITYELIEIACFILAVSTIVFSQTPFFFQVKSECETIQKLLGENCLVKKMEVLKALKKVRCVCFDKTNTLTHEFMEVQHMGCFDSKEKFEVRDSFELISILKSNQCFYMFIKEAVCLATGAMIGSGSNSGIGFRREQHLIRMIHKVDGNSQDYLSLRNHAKDRVMKINEFSSSRKRSSTVIQTNEGRYRVIVISDTEEILKSCSRFLDVNLKTHQLSTNEENEIAGSFKILKSEGQRFSIVTYRDFEDESLIDSKDEKDFPILESENLTFAGYFAYSQVPKPNASETIKNLQSAGIHSKLFTGDNKENAEYIAKSLGLSKNPNMSIDGRGFSMKVELAVDSKGSKVIKNMTNFEEIFEKIDVFYRFNPDEKFILVKGIKELGYPVAVVGDGSNDAPALIGADAGFAMAICGSDIAKEAASVIILDDSVWAVYKAFRLVQCLYAKVRSVKVFMKIHWLVVGFSCFITAAIIQQTLFSPAQVLFTFFLLDFAAVQVFGDLRPSRKLKRESVKFTKYLLFQTLAQLFILLIFTFIGEYLVLEFDSSRTSCVNPSNEGYICSGRFYKINGEYDYIHYYAEYGPSRHFTFIFNLFFFMQVFNMLNMTRSRKRVYKFNKMTLKTVFVLVLTLAVQVIATQFLNFYLNVNENGLSIVQWSLCVGYAAVPVLLDILYCLVFRR